MDHHDASDIPTTRTSSTSTAHAPAHAARPASPLSTLAMKDLPPSLACSLLPAADSRHVVSRVTASLSHRTSSGIAWHRAWTRSADASGRSLALGLRAALAFAVGASSLDVWGNWKGRVRSSGGGQGYEGHPSARFLVAASALTVSAAAAAAPGPQTALARTRMRGSASSIPLPMPTSLASSSPFVVVAARAYSSASTPASAPVVSTSTVTSSSRPLPVPFAPSTRPSTLPPSLAFSLSEEDDADADVDRVALDVPPEVTPLEYVGKITITDRAAEVR
ncbi:hypothetical protein M427DRAFT_346389 [Gonapodya prolifera JEL478]|uniref:Uncharacterized protein n=1 Tax=Gonapodya prolifera (strain JEL478) TaxID=1344416 RepID=A0A139AVT5_GONPJ|nr:hypothetical protein M427DRAFT_346389 [Gonapodya prolifera JEL478]|eukprot:KXS20840.1 hypothetical protein M427DRAFT_346389 [Gonapodya prolifera JEL478]